jgi:hypothetical protein
MQNKHLSYSFDKAQRMVEKSKRLDFPILGGSSLPVTWGPTGPGYADGLPNRGSNDGGRERQR